MAPTAFCRKASRSRHSACRSSPPTIATPPITSEWPFRYLVVECTTMSKPSSSGRCTNGLANVLSATAIKPCSRAICASAARSASFSSGLLGVSTHSILVSGRIAARTASRFARSTKVKSVFALRRRTRSNRRNVPPYRSSLATTCAPASSSSSTVEIAARPDANAHAVAPLSRSATQRSNAQRVGLCERP